MTAKKKTSAKKKTAKSKAPSRADLEQKIAGLEDLVEHQKGEIETLAVLVEDTKAAEMEAKIAELEKACDELQKQVDWYKERHNR